MPKDEVRETERLTTDPQPRKTTRARYLLALAITALVAIVQFVVLSDEIYASRRQTQIVSLASEQRTLAVEIASLASAYVDASSDERSDIRDRLATSVAALLDAERKLVDPAENPRGWPPTTVRDLFAGAPYQVSSRTNEFAERTASLLIAPPQALVRRNEDLLYLANVGPISRFATRRSFRHTSKRAMRISGICSGTKRSRSRRSY